MIASVACGSAELKSSAPSPPSRRILESPGQLERILLVTPLFSRRGTFTIMLENVVNNVYNGVYHVDITLFFYKDIAVKTPLIEGAHRSNFLQKQSLMGGFRANDKKLFPFPYINFHFHAKHHRQFLVHILFSFSLYRVLYITATMASISQASGVDALGLANMIISAARNATTHQKNCEQLAEHVRLISNLLEKLKSTDLINLPATQEPLEAMEEALRKAFDLVESCKDKNKSYLYMLAMGWSVVYQFRQVQAEIDRYLKIVPLISLVHEFRMQVFLLIFLRLPDCTRYRVLCHFLGNGQE
uniref:MCAfunc domain-containing protein n=1 Tax=Manihot esculenta TaxID=3983 RepID=A0A2C9VL40_MANES